MNLNRSGTSETKLGSADLSTRYVSSHFITLFFSLKDGGKTLYFIVFKHTSAQSAETVEYTDYIPVDVTLTKSILDGEA